MYFHNHQEEFQNQYVDEGVLKSAIDIIMERTDPRYVVAEIDVKWSSDALNDVTGTQTAAFINKPAYQARVQLMHVKDGTGIAGGRRPPRTWPPAPVRSTSSRSSPPPSTASATTTRSTTAARWPTPTSA